MPLGLFTTGATLARTVLIVDDSATIRSIIKVYLTSYRAETLEADDGERGLALARLMPVDLAIVDVKMPRMDGPTFVRELRKSDDPRVKKLPVVLLTSETGEDVRIDGLNAGANAFLRKPVTAEALKSVIDRLLAGAGT